MSEKKIIIKAGMIYTICNVVLRGISFFTIPLFIRLLTPEEFGRYNVFVSFEGILFMFSGLTMHASIKNAKYDMKDDYDNYIKNCVYLDALNTLALAVFANILCYFGSEIIDLNYFEINLLVISGFCGAVVSLYSSKLVMDYQANDYAILSFLSILFGIILSIVFIFTIFDNNHYYGRILGAVLGGVVAAAYAIIKIFKSGFSHIDYNQWKYGLKISLPIIPHGLSQIALSSANRIMIKYIYNAALAGIFSFTYTISLVPQILFSSLSSVWEPWFFEKMNQNRQNEIREKSTWFVILISVVFVLISFVVPEVVKILATEEYEDAIDVSIIVLMGCYFATLYYIPCEVEYYYKKTKHIATSTFLCAVINVSLNFILMQYFSYKIAAYTTLLAYLLYFIFHMFMARYILKSWLFDIRTMLIIIICSIFLMALSLFFIGVPIVRYALVAIGFIYLITKRDFVVKFIKVLRK